ncbi:MAG: hypothetical protein GW938_17645 [Leptospira sp.]|nr:hypothetical protein [Leptospira sp.]
MEKLEKINKLMNVFESYLSERPYSQGSHPGLLVNNWDGNIDLMVLEWWDEFKCHLFIETNGLYLRESNSGFIWHEMFNGNFEHGSLFLVYFSDGKVRGFSKIGTSELTHFIYKLHRIPHHELSGLVVASVE